MTEEEEEEEGEQCWDLLNTIYWRKVASSFLDTAKNVPFPPTKDWHFPRVTSKHIPHHNWIATDKKSFTQIACVAKPMRAQKLHLPPSPHPQTTAAASLSILPLYLRSITSNHLW